MALLRDQQRACLAYEKVAEVDVGVRDSYRIAVQDLGGEDAHQLSRRFF